MTTGRINQVALSFRFPGTRGSSPKAALAGPARNRVPRAERRAPSPIRPAPPSSRVRSSRRVLVPPQRTGVGPRHSSSRWRSGRSTLGSPSPLGCPLPTAVARHRSPVCTPSRARFLGRAAMVPRLADTPVRRVTKEARAIEPERGVTTPVRPGPVLSHHRRWVRAACREGHAGTSPATPPRHEQRVSLSSVPETDPGSRPSPSLPRPDSPSGIRIKGSTPSSPSQRVNVAHWRPHSLPPMFWHAEVGLATRETPRRRSS